ncbi:MAG: tetratricopeptide repeat protein [Massilia sp.]|nr:tetratricopeptide repeat protein [Massilia sp.]
MSLINKMLQDLDKRGSRPGASVEPNVLSVPRQRAPLSIALLLGAVLALVLLGAGLFGWRHFKNAPLVPRAGVAAPPSIVMAAPAPGSVVITAPLPATPPVPPVPAEPVVTPPAPATAAIARKAPAAASDRDAASARAVRRGPSSSSSSADAANAANAPETVRQTSTQQRAESAYRRALAALQEARLGEAIGALEQALALEPGHEAARQTLVGLLIENKRADEAMRQLEQGLALDARQPALAMLLARMQIERGDSGIDTLLRSLPHALGNADYHAFLAGALQRQLRHREAVEQYQAAVRAVPQNGVWLMGLGISLQAQKRNADALDAFRQARAANLSPQLQEFVERKVQQLSH